MLYTRTRCETRGRWKGEKKPMNKLYTIQGFLLRCIILLQQQVFHHLHPRQWISAQRAYTMTMMKYYYVTRRYIVEGCVSVRRHRRFNQWKENRSTIYLSTLYARRISLYRVMLLYTYMYVLRTNKYDFVLCPLAKPLYLCAFKFWFLPKHLFRHHTYTYIYECLNNKYINETKTYIKCISANYYLNKTIRLYSYICKSWYIAKYLYWRIKTWILFISRP